MPAFPAGTASFVNPRPLCRALEKPVYISRRMQNSDDLNLLLPLTVRTRSSGENRRPGTNGYLAAWNAGTSEPLPYSASVQAEQRSS